MEETNESFYELIKRTNTEKPAKADLERLATHLAKHPEEAARLGNLVNQVEVQLIDKFKHSKLQWLTLSDYTLEMRAKMGYKDASFIERGLIDHVVLCWLRLHTCELEYEQCTKGVSLPMALYWEKKLSAHQRRYLRAVETLARIRKLGISVQINIGDKQVINQV